MVVAQPAAAAVAPPGPHIAPGCVFLLGLGKDGAAIDPDRDRVTVSVMESERIRPPARRLARESVRGMAPPIRELIESSLVRPSETSARESLRENAEVELIALSA